jgi:hypothetical protein
MIIQEKRKKLTLYMIQQQWFKQHGGLVRALWRLEPILSRYVFLNHSYCTTQLIIPNHKNNDL